MRDVLDNNEFHKANNYIDDNRWHPKTDYAGRVINQVVENFFRQRERERMAAKLARQALRTKKVGLQDATNTGHQIVILASGSDGYGIPRKLVSMEHADQGTLLAHNLASHRSVTTRLKTIFRKDDYHITLFSDATSEHLDGAIKDPKVQSIYLLGHASYGSWVATNQTINWQKTGDMVGDHLKDGVFANMGCGEIRESDCPTPIGNFVVAKSGILIGKYDELAGVHEMSDPSRYRQLPVVA